MFEVKTIMKAKVPVSGFFDKFEKLRKVKCVCVTILVCSTPIKCSNQLYNAKTNSVLQ